MAYSWESLIPYGVQFGLGTLGNRITTGPQRGQNEWERQRYEEERKRRNLMQSFAAPSMFKALGYQPDQIPQMTSQVRGNQLGSGSTGNVSATPQSGTSKALGAAGTGLGIAGTAGSLGLLGGLGGATKVGLGGVSATQGASAIPGALGLGGGAGILGLGAATIPVLGGLLAGGAYAANKIGQGRRTANTATGEGGFERNFNDALARISAGQGTLADLQAARQQYEQGANAYIGAGGNQRKVGQQSLNNQDLQETYRRLLAQLGGS